MYLWVDDIRHPPGEGWDVARNWEEAIALLEKNQYHTVSLDHDLGEKELSGYHIVKWMVLMGRLPGRVILHTSNPVGRNSMREALQAVGYKNSNPLNLGACTNCPTMIHSDV